MCAILFCHIVHKMFVFVVSITHTILHTELNYKKLVQTCKNKKIRLLPWGCMEVKSILGRPGIMPGVSLLLIVHFVSSAVTEISVSASNLGAGTYCKVETFIL